MPVHVSKAKGGGYRVSTPHGVKAKHATKANAMAQKRLLNAVEHGWKPTGKPADHSSFHHSVNPSKPMMSESEHQYIRKSGMIKC